MSINMDDEIWESLLTKIREEKCVLVMGPDIAAPEADRSMVEVLKDYLVATSKKDKQIKFYVDDEFFLFQDNLAKGYANIKIKKFYEQLKTPEVYAKIAEIPFHLIISVSPDHLLKNVFDTGGLDVSFDYYNKEQNPGVLEKPSIQKPLVYNLFGDIDAESSLIFTYDDLFEYLTKIFGDFKLPQALQFELRNCESVLFIGFRFEKWYFRLLLRLLRLNEVGIKGASEKNKSFQDVGSVRNFYADEFKMEFIDADEVEIIDFLHTQFGEKQELRKPKKPVAGEGNEIFISYAWGGESEEVVNSLYNTLTEKGYRIIRDKVDLGYKGNIKTFMDTIGTGKYVLVVISDKYLRSPNCMYEMLEIRKNADVYNRIFPIILSDANIYNEINRLKYIVYWEQQMEELNTQIRALSNLERSDNVVKTLNQYGDIRRIMDDVTDMLRNMNTLTPDMHLGNNFSELIKALDLQIAADNKK